MEENDPIIDDGNISLDDVTNYSDEDPATQRLFCFVEERFSKAETSRRTDEERWLQSYRNYRGIYGPNVQFTDSERSRVFIKITKTKTLAAYGQIVDVLFAGQKFPLTVDPTELPDGVVEDVSFDPAEPDNIREDGKDKTVSPYGFKGDGMEFPKGATAKTLNE